MSATLRDPLALPSVPPPAPADHVKRDRLVASVFVLALLLPLYGAIAQRDLATTRFENRPAAAWPDAAVAQRAWREWTSAFEAAFGDRFGGRDALIAIHHRAKAEVFGVSPVATVAIGRDGWLYFLGEDGLAVERDYRGAIASPAEWIANAAAEYKRRHDYLASLGIRYAVMIVPDKATIYPEHLPAWMTRVAPRTRLDMLFDAMRAYPEVTMLDLRPALVAAKARERTYFMTDSHWNLVGATIGYLELSRVLSRWLPGYPAVPPPRPEFVKGVDIWVGDLAKLAGLAQTHREDDIAPLGRVLADARSRCAQPATPPFPAGVPAPASETLVFACDRPGLPSALVYRDSMMIAMVPLLSENFRRSVYVSDRRLDRALVERERPDVVIDEMVERSMDAPGFVPMR